MAPQKFTWTQVVKNLINSIPLGHQKAENHTVALEMCSLCILIHC